MTSDVVAPIAPLARAYTLIDDRRVLSTSSLIAGPPEDPGIPFGTWPLQVAPQLRRVRASIDELARRRYAHPSNDALEGSLLGVLERLALVVSELGGNAVRHAQAPVTVSLARLPHGWLLSVSDGAPQGLPRVEPDHVAYDHRHGLQLVAVVSTAVGWYAEENTKHVWALVPDLPTVALTELLP